MAHDVSPEYVVGAIRLAVEAAANDETAICLIRWLLEQAPAPHDDDKGSMPLFFKGIRELGLAINSELPIGAYA